MNSRLDHITDWQTRAERARFRVNILAKICGVTDRQLRRYFTAKFGSSPHSWLTVTRLEKVRPLLCQGDLVKEAAAIAGFSQQANFSRQFKRFYNANPSSFRVLFPDGLKLRMQPFFHILFPQAGQQAS